MTEVVVNHFKPYQLYRNTTGIAYVLALTHEYSYTNYYLDTGMVFLVLAETEASKYNFYNVKILTTLGIHWFYPGDDRIFEEL